ncbi:3'-5' exonuclease [Gallalistipes aquisgranensis]|uniref:3'-5' exonuclease n=1 Tax=Gallalistipes aquisgranensis TaxID=2779358 RepID=UPI001CF9163D|nr:3'-5' exonuclease [Gallalistipes aquisgranensis]MBE5033838.1 3'-5' exonuclease domain-containing protein 2 [Gallalistipes aquisgranensis]
MNTPFQANISNEELAALPLAQFPGRITVVDREEMLAEACAELMGRRAIGFDTETRPSFTSGISNKVALLQLSTPDHCFLFRLCKLRLDKALIRVLESPDVLKIGAAVRDDIKGMQKLRHYRPAGFIDLQSIVENYGIAEKSVRKMAAVTLGIRISKAQRLSNWEASTLTPAQQLYAATDAWVSLEIYRKLLSFK